MLGYVRIQLSIFISNSLIKSIYFFADEREAMEMNAAACLNKKCDAFIDFNTKPEFPMKCNKCDQSITAKHYEAFKDMVSVTREHLDKMKVSSMACKRDYFHFFLV